MKYSKLNWRAAFWCFCCRMPARGHGGHGGRGHGMHSHGIGAAHHRPHHPHPIGHQYPLHSRPMSHYHHGFHNHRHHHFGYRGGAMGGVMVPPRTRKAMITRTVIGGLVSTLIALPMIVVGALLIADIWKIKYALSWFAIDIARCVRDYNSADVSWL